MAGRIVILAGGVASRMRRSLGDFPEMLDRYGNEAGIVSKSMIAVGSNSRPFMDYLLDNVLNASYNEIVIVVNDKDNVVREYYQDKRVISGRKDFEISFAVQEIPTGHVKPLGTADALLKALKSKPEWSGNAFTVCNSDNIYSVQALGLLKDSTYRNAMIGYNSMALKLDAEKLNKFAIILKDDEGCLKDIIEKPSRESIQTRGGLHDFEISMNIFRFDYDMILPILETVPVHPERGEKDIPQGVRMLVNRYPKSMHVYTIAEKVPDLTEKNDIAIVDKTINLNNNS